MATDRSLRASGTLGIIMQVFSFESPDGLLQLDLPFTNPGVADKDAHVPIYYFYIYIRSYHAILMILMALAF